MANNKSKSKFNKEKTLKRTLKKKKLSSKSEQRTGTAIQSRRKNRISTRQNPEKKRFNYTQEALERAIKAIKEGVTLRNAADTFGVPKSTLLDKSKESEPKIKKGGPPTVLSPK